MVTGINKNTITVKFISSKGIENDREEKIELVLINQKKKNESILLHPKTQMKILVGQFYQMP